MAFKFKRTDERLTPLPHLIKSIRSRNWSMSGAMMEWVDNSLQHGKANEVEIVVDNTYGIGIRDTGIGIDDINRVFTLGDASAYGDLSNVGQYGVGATDAMIYLGDVATVKTVRDGRIHEMTVNWADVETSGQWPLRYTGAGKPTTAKGTSIIVQQPHVPFYYLKTVEQLARELGLTFAPALRGGSKIKIMHRLVSGEDHEIEVQPFTPDDLTDLTAIEGNVGDEHIKMKGTVKTLKGPLHWTGRAGLSASLVERHNGVHIAFGHRVIEMTRDAFMGVAAPTLYVEVQLDDKTPWKYQLSDHKDKVVAYRDELMESIHAAIKPLLEKSKTQSTDLALMEFKTLIETPINKALKTAGLLYREDDVIEEVPIRVGKKGGKGKGKKIFELAEDGEPAKEVKRPHGIRIDYRDPKTLEGRAFTWSIDDMVMTIGLDRELFEEVLDWPPKVRDKHAARLVVSFLAHAVQMLFNSDNVGLRKAVTKQLYEDIEGWSTEDANIAPYLYRRLIASVTVH